ncbi:MAG: c-type cytochrome [Gammaproteobacteria bacterium]|nr:c-type cytochrome [Gammaproteobacteria bacterium]MDH4255017.1 c-type cytochrome [Gammaproteobacteria bacterium]MDH5310780.1 c-type cytochrome [Gammaproteobacteria bacterium]
MKYPLASCLFGVLLAVFMGPSAGAAEESPVSPDDLVYCTVCHGMQLRGNRNIEAPRLSEMDAWYIEQQLVAFKNGWRGTHPQDLIGMEMRPMAAALNDTQIKAAAKFAQASRAPVPAATVDGDADAGRTHYSTCAACHGVDASGNEALGAPPLAGLNDWYLVRQLENFRDGVRGSHPDDLYGAQMRASAALLPDDQAIRDVVAYITSLQTN